ncbi:hypothetical protein C1922_02270 [Stenotrophomonas sp. ZAC14D2_NAIMI4_7]|uniref:hypothetical protein n=1 Tax=Stenotrophomonas sp. ZAC14D2_NAIMI4_7 TaxID=2072405 RepID=UPI000D540955|nr:hypothetical protein [Stenotrophomonas sp. ZAC14D2_NAIMI4_7]AWH16234.1 hypothetical protein C1922_02270 [Stenotrophomonas sp. ZAC14D2_NAIMI4_7]
MSNVPVRRLACAALVAALGAAACAKAPSTERDSDGTLSQDASSSRTVGGHTYTTQPVEARLGPHRFMFPANLYYDQTGPHPDGGVMLTVFWPDFGAAPPGNRPVRSVEDSQRQVLIELNYLDRVPIADYLGRRSSNDATAEAGSLRSRNPAQRLELRDAQAERWGLTPYAINPALMDAYVKDSEAELGVPYRRKPALEPDWYVARSTDGRLTTFISCDPADRVPDGLSVQGSALESTGAERIAMCRHSMVDMDDNITIEMGYARVMLRDWQRLESAVRALLRSHKITLQFAFKVEPGVD